MDPRGGLAVHESRQDGQYRLDGEPGRLVANRPLHIQYWAYSSAPRATCAAASPTVHSEPGIGMPGSVMEPISTTVRGVSS